MRTLLLVLLAVLCVAGLCFAAPGAKTPGFLATYSTAKTAACVRGSLAHSKTQVFICWSTGKWKKATFN
jgi:hypothetical protein